ncbi:MAG: class I tRNA ligase family protein, partial [Pseudomonadota bacterium]|nr:class I tRNA ligase family protein [Pseudomonadota bacterium]
RLGIGGQWDKPYLTMNFSAEGTIVAELMKFSESGQLYRGAKPVMWSPVEKTALAEAEIEYEDIVSTQIDVAFEIVESPIPELVGAYAVVWTTTPWTIPVNQAIAYGPEIEYVLIYTGLGSDPGDYRLDVFDWVESQISVLGGQHFLVAKDLLQGLAGRLSAALEKLDFAQFGVKPYVCTLEVVGHYTGSELAGTIARHPMHHLGGFYAKPRPFLPGDFVTTDTGTGLVHMSPDHGEDDFALCKEHGIDPVFAVEGDGKYREDWGWLGGQGSVINNKFNDPDGPICNDLRESGGLLAASADYKHSYPHSWRSKAKVIYRCTPQWFIAMDRPLPADHCESFAEQRWGNEGGALEHSSPTLRQLAMRAIADTRFVPEKGRNRIGSMVEGRPDWVLSRQRAWGVPIAVFVERKTGELLVDRQVNVRVIEAIAAEGVDAWDAENAAHFLGAGRNPDDYEMVTDILDVWFDSGCTHVFTLESGKWPEQRWPADLYLEGSDQHRGWFQSSLLESCGTRGRAPYNAVLTHGFTMDPKGMKMSKSVGNTIDPLKVMETNGADIIRLWALSVDYTEDHRIGDEILKGVSDQYRKLRNSFRYLLGALAGFSDEERVSDVADMPELERYMLHLTAELDGKLRRAVGDFDFNTYTRLLSDFANNDLSAFYFDIRKDVLYCDVNALTGEQSERRRAYRTVLDLLFHALVRWSAPVLVFTSEEVWGTRFPDGGSVHLLEWPEIGTWSDPDLGRKWHDVRGLRDRVNEAIEPLRREKALGSSLQADVVLRSDPVSFTWDQLAEIFIVSSVRTDLGNVQTVTKTNNNKCGRCWRYLPEVPDDGALCGRCEEFVDG